MPSKADNSETTITERSRLSLPLPVFWSMLLILASIVASVVYATTEITALRKSVESLAVQFGKNNEQLISLDKRLAVMEDVRERVSAVERRVQLAREDLMSHCFRTGDTSRIGNTGGPAKQGDKILTDY